jgi:hypothetical protein
MARRAVKRAALAARRRWANRGRAGVPPQRPRGAARASMFFDAYPRFYETSRTSPQRGRLNLRYEAIFAENRDVFEGARVLDIASHDGRWSLAALETGATAVVGIEAKGHLVAAAQKNLSQYYEGSGTYRFVSGDVFEALASEAFAADVVLCLGFLYHTLRYPELMRLVRNLGPRYLVIDTFVVPGEQKPLVHLYSEETGSQRNAVTDAFSHGNQTLVGWPSRRGLEALVEAYGFSVERYSDWGSLIRDNPGLSNVSDYAEGRRVTARCVSVG